MEKYLICLLSDKRENYPTNKNIEPEKREEFLYLSKLETFKGGSEKVFSLTVDDALFYNTYDEALSVLSYLCATNTNAKEAYFIMRYYKEQDKLYFYQETDIDKLYNKYQKILPVEMFVEMLENIKAQEAKSEKVGKALEEYVDGHFVFDTNNLYLKSLLSIVSNVLSRRNKPDTLEWYLYEFADEPNKKCYYLGNRKLIITPYTLYLDLLIDRYNAVDNITANQVDIANKTFFDRYSYQMTEEEIDRFINLNIPNITISEMPVTKR